MEANGKLHPGISMHKIPVSGIVGLLFVVCTMLVFLLGIPGLWLFFGSAIAIGLALAGALWVIHKHVAAAPRKILKL